MEALKVGDPMQAETELGPLASSDAVASLQTDVQATVKAGARVLTGGAPKGNFFPPTVLTDIPEDSPAYHEELFGPVGCVFRVKNIDEAIRIANDTRFGLEPAPGPTTRLRRPASRASSRPAWSSLIKWWRPIPACLSAASSSPVTGGSWECTGLGSSRI